jgi:glycosyltransferase involved in cell wall biosynthesis
VTAPQLTVVLPVFDERESLDALADRLIPVLQRLTGGGFEIIFVDDGSTDGSAEMLDALHLREPRIRVVHLSRNFGHQAAVHAGLVESRGEAVVVMDADLQDRPTLLGDFVARWREGYEVVYGIRRQRKEGLLKRGAYALFYRSLRLMAQVPVALDAGDFCLLDRRVVDAVVALPEQHRFLRGLRAWVGFRQIGVECERDARAAGASKYTFRKAARLALEGYIGFSAMPLRMASVLGVAAACGGFVVAGWVVVTKLLDVPSPRGWASILACVLVLGGVQLLTLGIIGEYLSRVYDEVRRRPPYVIRRRVGFDDEAAETPRLRTRGVATP